MGLQHRTTVRRLAFPWRIELMILAPTAATNIIVEPTSLELAHLRAPAAGKRMQPYEQPRTYVLKSKSPDGAVWALGRAALRILLRQSVIILHAGTSNRTFRQRLGDFWQNIVNNRDELWNISFWLTFSASIFIGLSIGATTVSYLQSDNMALSTSPNCGEWVSAGLTKQMLYAWNQGEEQAASYYRSCYEADPTIQQCNIYANNDPLSNVTNNDDCPFQGNVCLLGPQSAVTFDTGYLDVNTLGINSRNRPFYRRKTTCAPLATRAMSKCKTTSQVS
jgi:hypothetical protein